jgi:flagellar hook-length control protein FliK
MPIQAAPPADAPALEMPLASILSPALPDTTPATPPPGTDAVASMLPAPASLPAAPVARSEAPPPAAPPRPHGMAKATQQIALRVATAAAEGVESVSVDLRPPELGRVELRLTFQDGTVQVSMAAERGDTFEALRQDRASLEQQMQQAGLQLSGGGLDLQHGRLPRPATPAEPAPQRATMPAAPDDEPAPRAPLRSDSLIDLIA